MTILTYRLALSIFQYEMTSTLTHEFCQSVHFLVSSHGKHLEGLGEKLRLRLHEI